MIYLKVYRVIPSAFFTYDRICSEDIYYEMGYASFLCKKTMLHIDNNLQCAGKQRKYFFLFFEDAALMGSRFLFNNHSKVYTDIFSIVEYDVLDDVLLEHIGCGSYSLNEHLVLRTEAFIEKANLGNSVSFD